MKGICELYKINTELRESHIYPKFVIKQTKRSGSKYFRKITDPNKRHQDGLKLHLLSEQAEQDFSKREKWFAENIFVPYLSGKKTLTYNENLYYFAISFLWRILVVNLKTITNIKDLWHYEDLLKVEIEWRNYLINGTLPKDHKKTYILFTDRIEENNTILKGVDLYFTRVMDATIVDNPTHTSLMIYGKFSRFIFWSVLKEYGKEESLTEVEINPKGGLFKIPQKIDYFPIQSFWGNRIQEISSYPLPNEKQQDIILKEILKNPEEFWNSDVGKSLFNDKFNLDK